MYNLQDIQQNFSKAQKFLHSFGASMQQNNEDHASKMISFAMGHLQEILMKIKPKEETVTPRKEVVIEAEEPELEINESDFVLSVD